MLAASFLGAILLPLSAVAAKPAAPVCGTRTATIAGTPGNDVIMGTSGDDVITGGGGNDTIYGLDGNDRICGDENGIRVGGDDEIFGGPGNDRAMGDAADVTTGGADRIFGEGGTKSSSSETETALGPVATTGSRAVTGTTTRSRATAALYGRAAMTKCSETQATTPV
jgi:hypothetical protein